jgi:hypothetical protein
VNDPVERYQPQDQEVAQRAIPERYLEFLQRRKPLRGRVGRWLYIKPRVTSQASNEPTIVPNLDAHARVGVGQFGNVRGRHHVPLYTANE